MNSKKSNVSEHRMNTIRQRIFQIRIEGLYVVGLLLAALLLFGINLGDLPLRDWDEGTVAQVAREISDRGDFQSLLFPTLGGQPYLNKPPLVHGLIALTYALAEVNEWTTRLPGALLTAVSVPLLYAMGREIFPRRRSALFSALTYLTLLPVVRHGRLAMLDGAVLCFAILMFLCILKCRRDLRWSLGVGLSFGALCLTKGMMGLLLGAIALLFLVWDTPRLLTSVYLWRALICGSIPVIAWYAAQWIHYGEAFVTTSILDQSLERIWTPVEGNLGPPWYYLWELVKNGWSWLLFYLYGLHLAWCHRNWSWAKLILIWSGVYFLAVSLMATKLPWYIMPIYPPLALAVGGVLADVFNWPSNRSYPRSWFIWSIFLAVTALVGCIYFGFSETTDRSLVVILGAIALTMGVVGVLIERKDAQFIAVMFWGMYIALLLFFLSPHWIWELNEAYPVKPVAAMIKFGVPQNQVVYTNFDYARPSLDFYSQHRVIPASTEEIQLYWRSSEPYLLLEADIMEPLLPLESALIIGTARPNWVLIAKDR